MSTNALYTISALTVAGNTVDQIESMSIDPAIQNHLARSSGLVYPKAAYVLGARPMARFATTNLVAALGQIGITGKQVTGSNLVLYFQQYDEGGTRKAGATGMTLTLVEGLIVPRGISVSQDGGPAVYTCEVYCTSADGTTAPWTISTAATNSLTVDEAVKHFLGPVKVNGSTLANIKSVEIDFGCQGMVEASDGDIFPTFAYVESSGPSVTLRGTAATWLNTYGQTGTAQSTTDSVIYLKRGQEGGTRYADDDAGNVHVSFTIDEGIWAPLALEGQMGPATAGLRCDTTYDGTALPLAISTGCKIV